MSNALSLDNPLTQDLAPARDRAAQPRDMRRIPKGFRIISADDHWEQPDDIFYERFPAELKHKAPRVWFDRFWRMGDPSQKATSPSERALEAKTRCPA
jgi:hypothetical protein